ncbi:MAG: hypothetical protein F2817_01905 [Actinobacteria bacterium]|nr:hypothetical protein [Actinomycetota bacterium]
MSSYSPAEEQRLPPDDDLTNRRVTVGMIGVGVVLLAVGLASSSGTPTTVGATFLVLAGPIYLLGRANAGRHPAVAWWPTDGPNPGERTAVRGDATTVLVRTVGWDAVTGRDGTAVVILVERQGIRAWAYRARHDLPTLADLGLTPDGRPRVAPD